MIHERVPSDQQLFEMTKILRTAVRLKHSIAADRELNKLLPDAQQRFLTAVQKGELPEAVDLKAIVREVLPE